MTTGRSMPRAPDMAHSAMRGRLRRVPRAAFTLLELIVAITITGVAIASGYAAFGTLTDRQQIEVARSDVDARAAGVRRMVREWVVATRLTLGETAPFRGIDDVRLSADGARANDDLVFLTSASTPIGDGVTQIRLFVDRSDTTIERGLVAELVEWRGTRSMRVEVAPEVDGFDVRYLSEILGARQWLPSWVSNTVLPAAVEVRLTAASGRTLHPLLALPMVIPVEGGR